MDDGDEPECAKPIAVEAALVVGSDALNAVVFVVVPGGLHVEVDDGVEERVVRVEAEIAPVRVDFRVDAEDAIHVVD